MGNNTQSRKWTMVINNPLEAGLDHNAIIEIPHKFSPTYFCIADEIAATGTYHTHVFLYVPSPMRFSTIKNRFPTAHIEKAYGSAADNRDYITKSGKWASTDKSETSIPDTFVEWGTLPSEKDEQAPEMFRLMARGNGVFYSMRCQPGQTCPTCFCGKTSTYPRTALFWFWVRVCWDL